jgi:hypothetical protein
MWEMGDGSIVYSVQRIVYGMAMGTSPLRRLEIATTELGAGISQINGYIVG